jgi:hypothetical protein
MTDITEKPDTFPAVPLLAEGEDVKGGDEAAPSNKQAVALAARTDYLKAQLAALIVGGLNVIGTLNTHADLDAIPTEDLKKGDAYFVESSLCVWNMIEWVDSGSLLGPRGITLLGRWPDGLALPTRDNNEVGDAYIWKSDIWLLIPEPDDWVTIGLKGDTGDSAYDIAVAGGFSGTKPQWLVSLVGKSAYQSWKDQGNTGTEAEFAASLVGKTAYQIWLGQGNSGTEAEWLLTLVGKSAYQTWKDNGHPAGTEAEFLESLKGTNGESGSILLLGTLNNFEDLDAIPTAGLSVGDAYFVAAGMSVWNGDEWIHSNSLLGKRGITVLGQWPDAVPLPAVDANEIGDAYYWKKDIWMLIPVEGWVTIGLKGDDGLSAYDLAKAAGFPGTQSEYLTSLIGKSAYQSWKDLGNSGTEAQFIASLKGVKGDAGAITLVGTLDNEAALDAIPTAGLAIGTAYFVQGALRIWNGTDWPSSGSLLGQRGVTLLGTWPDGSALPAWQSSTIGDAYIWKSDLWLLIPGGDGSDPDLDPVWNSIGLEGPEGQSAYDTAVETGFVGTKPQWLATLIGKSAYQIWKDRGGVGDEDAFLASLVSVTPGPEGPEGPARAPFEVKGSKVNEAALPTPGTPTEAWYVGSHLYVWVTDPGEYVDLGSVGGLSAYDLAVTDGYGGTLQQWLTSLHSVVPGPEGPRGQNLNVKGTVANAPQLGNIVNPVEQDGYVTDDDGHLHVLTGGNWVDVGPFRGQSTYQLWLSQGFTGSSAEFLASLKGTNGTNGTNIIVKGSVATYTALPASPAEQDVWAVRDTNTLYAQIGGNWVALGSFKGADGENGSPGANGSSITIIKILTPGNEEVPDPVTNPGKAYVDLNNILFISLGGVWVDCGPVGAPGPKGDQGTGINLRGYVAGPQYLPSIQQGAQNGDGWFIVSSKELYVLTEGEWEGPFDITGPEGPAGENGEKGDPGTSIQILGAYNTIGDLAVAHPTGTLGDGYLVGNNLAIWTTAEGGKWIDIGLVRGPQGVQGVQGPIGIGKKGDKGDKGSVWITLPAGVDEPGAGFTGNIGDWAVSETFKVYYKSAVGGWQYWGQLVAGDVNSPLLSFGKAVRLGNEWIVLPVDEVPDMEPGKMYVRSLKDGNTDNEGEWVELPFPGFADVPTDSNTYLRKGDHTWLQYNVPTITSLGGVPVAELGVSVPTLVAGKIPAGQLPSYVDDVLEFANQAAFPATGETGKIYISLATNAQFRWTGSVYIGLVASPGTTDAVAEGTTNLYHTPARVRAVTLAGVSFGTGGAITAADTVLTAFGKIQAQITAFVPGFADVPTDTNLYVRKGDKTWVVLPAQGIAAPANDGKQYVYKGTGWVSFDRYDVPILALSATGGIDPNVNLFCRIDNSGATAKTITLADGPKTASPNGARALVVVVKVNGAAGVITFAPTGATPLVWNTGSPPALTGSRTYLTFTWDGVEWVGAAGAVVP